MTKCPGELLRTYIANREIILAPGAFDGLSAHLVRRAGFNAVYASGGAISRSLGFPDIGLVSMTEMADRLRYIVEAAEVPVISDADTGYGGPMGVWRTVRAFGQAGIGALHIEDQTSPKRCGHLEGKTLIEPAEMVEKIIAAKEAASASNMIIIARTDAIAVEGFEKALERARSYEAAGAEVLFVEAPESVDQIRTIGKTIGAPKMLNMFGGGRTPRVENSELSELGFDIVIVPSDLQRVSIRAMERVLNEIATQGSSKAISDEFGPLSHRDTVVEADSYAAHEARFREKAERLT